MSPLQLEATPLLALAYALLLYGVAFILARLLLKSEPVQQAITASSGRYGSVDGLRGVLALGVLVHHSYAAYGYFAYGRWTWSSSAVLNQLGQTTVALFFMISGFLFTTKVMSPTVDWKALYLSRIARLTPLYALVVSVVFLAVFALSDGVIREPAWDIVAELVQWLAFVCFDRPNINDFPMTWTLIAGVNWTLKYEVLFYLFWVPVLYGVARLLPPYARFVAALAAICIAMALLMNGVLSGMYITHFLGGILVAYAYAISPIRSLMQKMLFRYLAVAAAVLLLFMPDSNNVLALFCALIIFTAIVGGASAYGILATRGALWLGDISYGIYLIHGLVLWFTLYTLRGMFDLQQIGLLSYVAVVVMVVGAVVMLASLSYAKMEKPIMAWASGKSRRPPVC